MMESMVIRRMDDEIQKNIYSATAGVSVPVTTTAPGVDLASAAIAAATAAIVVEEEDEEGYGPVQRPEVIRPQVTRPQAVRPQAVRPQAVRPQAVRPEAVRPQAVRPEAVRPQAVRPQAVRPQAVRPQPIRPQAVRPQPIRPQVRPQADLLPSTNRPELELDLELEPVPVRPNVIRPDPVRTTIVQHHQDDQEEEPSNQSQQAPFVKSPFLVAPLAPLGGEVLKPIPMKVARPIPQRATEKFYDEVYKHGLLSSDVHSAVIESHDWHRKWTQQDEEGHTMPEPSISPSRPPPPPQQSLLEAQSIFPEFLLDRECGARNPFGESQSGTDFDGDGDGDGEDKLGDVEDHHGMKRGRGDGNFCGVGTRFVLQRSTPSPHGSIADAAAAITAAAEAFPVPRDVTVVQSQMDHSCSTLYDSAATSSDESQRPRLPPAMRRQRLNENHHDRCNEQNKLGACVPHGVHDEDEVDLCPPPTFNPPATQNVLIRPVAVRPLQAAAAVVGVADPETMMPSFALVPEDDHVIPQHIRDHTGGNVSPLTLLSGISYVTGAEPGTGPSGTDLADVISAEPMDVAQQQHSLPALVEEDDICDAVSTFCDDENDHTDAGLFSCSRRRDELIHELIINGGDGSADEFQNKLQPLAHEFSEKDVDTRQKVIVDNDTNANVLLDGTWLTLTKPTFFGCLGFNDDGDPLYTFGRMSFDMFSPTGLVCSLQGNFNQIELVTSEQREQMLDSGLVPKSLREEVQNPDVVLRTYNIITAFTIEPPLADYPNAPNKDVHKPIRGIMTTYGYTIPDPKEPNRHSIWITGGKIEPNTTHQDVQEWKRLFSKHPPRHTFGEKAKLLAVKLLMGANIPEAMNPEDGSMVYSFTRPLGGHGIAYVDVQYLDNSLRVVRGHRGTTFVFSRMVN